MTGDLPKWAMGDPAKVYERLEGMRRHPPNPPGESRQETARQGLEQLFSEENMTKDESEQLEDLLLTWFYWANAHREHLGHGRVSPGFQHADAEAGDVYDDGDEREAKLNRYMAEQVDVCLNTLPVDLRAAIGIHIANKAAGNQVYRNPRATPEQQHARYQMAKELLLPMLRRRDMIKMVAIGLATARYAG